MPRSSPTVAIVIPVFNEQAVLPELFSRLAALFDAQRECMWRAVLVDDGSRDDSAALIEPKKSRGFIPAPAALPAGVSA